jgi:putative redox protein
VDALAAALAGCMTTDVTDILLKGRYTLRALKSHFTAVRAETDPRRFVSVSLHIVVEGNAPSAAIERAISLSRDKYCSVWHSMRQDIEFTVTFDVEP